MLMELVSSGIFRLCHRSQLVYNTCWEDPRCDRVALRIGPDDHLLVITSGGCNVLDYLLDEPCRIHAVDMNPRQNALLELKLAGIRALDSETFFALFGQGYLGDWREVYTTQLRGQLSAGVRAYWDANGQMFSSRRRRGSFYYRGSSGMCAWLANVYIDRIAKVRNDVDALFASTTLEEQRHIYHSRIRPAFWGPLIRWITRRDLTLSMLGVPQAQRRQIDEHYPGGLSEYIIDQLDELFTNVPLRDNYFWRVYVYGEYTRECCPEYLKPHNFRRLQEGLVDRVEIHTDTVLGFLRTCPTQISRFVLLDHMDWLCHRGRQQLQQEWQAIVERAAPRARMIWRSAASRVDFIDTLDVSVDGTRATVGQLMRYDEQLAAQLHAQDRVHTYGSFYIAELDKERVARRAAREKGDNKEDECGGNVEDTGAAQLIAHSR